MEIPETAVLLRIYITEQEKWEHRPLHEALVLKAREMQIAGATVLRGVMGYGQTTRLHTAKILDLSLNLPLVIEIVDGPAKIEAFLLATEGMITHGLVTQENVRVVRQPGAKTG